jgi:hypothetical protein
VSFFLIISSHNPFPVLIHKTILFFNVAASAPQTDAAAIAEAEKRVGKKEE